MKLSPDYRAPGIESQTMVVHNGSLDAGFTERSPSRKAASL